MKHSLSEDEMETFPASEKVYDAFINHRGPDVKQTLAFAIYESLEEKGFKTFLDEEVLEAGDPIQRCIENAISSSKVQIAIFSPGYAESSWCLNELLHMLKTKARFIPIFCDVNPCDVRYRLKGVYKHAFDQHQEKGRFSKEIIQQWTDALHSSSNIVGYEFCTSTDNVEALCTKIALAVEKVVGKSTSMGFPREMEASKYERCVGADSAASASTSAQANKKSSLLPRDSHAVGIDSKVEDMVRLLQNPQFPAIAVVGMGGLGKTFLLQNVYHETKSNFDISVWLSISRSYSVKNLQRDIASRAGLKAEIVDTNVSEQRAAELIYEHLQGKTCLIVLDDLWKLDIENGLLDRLGLTSHEDCKVVVTTRNKDVAHTLKAHIYEIKMLSDEESWELFCWYAFPDCEAQPHLEEVGREIVKECGNLPLAIETTAASLARTRGLSEWESKRDQLKRATIPFGEHDPVMDILKLSYDDLPQHLKPCFAYLSFFPEDAIIDAEYLVYLWIAEGFVPAGEERWDMAWDWLHQLHQLCLLQLWENPNCYSLLTKHCKIHDLLHDLAIDISRQNKCAFSVKEAFTHTSGCCRILLAKKYVLNDSAFDGNAFDDNAFDDDFYALSQNTPAYLRTLSLSENSLTKRIPENLFNGVRGLRVLDLSSTSISTLPKSVGKMILLKVLNLRDTEIYEVPECVRYLKSLLFLALGDEAVSALPEWINELKCLQHLEYSGELAGAPKGIFNMVSLRTLRTDYPFTFSEDLGKMTQLQEVSISVKNDMEFETVADLVHLRRLEVFNEMKIVRFPETMRAMKHLEMLFLQKIVVPNWICDLANLRDLTLLECVYTDFPEFQRMPNLVRLSLQYQEDFQRNKGCKELSKAFGMSGGFPRLRFLQITYFEELEELLRLEEGAMPYLEAFELKVCSAKNVGEELVEGLKRLKRLKWFMISGREEGRRIQLFQQHGEYWNRIKEVNSHVEIEVCYSYSDFI